MGFFLTFENASNSLYKYSFIECNLALNINDFIYIFSKNILVAVFYVFFGYFSVGTITLLVSVYNGILLGVVCSSYLECNSLFDLLINLIHAPFEILALCIYGAIGLCGFKYEFRVNSISDFIILLNSTKIYNVTAFILLLIAAMIETSVKLKIYYK